MNATVNFKLNTNFILYQKQGLYCEFKRHVQIIKAYRLWAEMDQVGCHACHCSLTKCCTICFSCLLIHCVHHFYSIFELFPFNLILKFCWKPRLKFNICSFTIISLDENLSTVLKRKHKKRQNNSHSTLSMTLKLGEFSKQLHF